MRSGAGSQFHLESPSPVLAGDFEQQGRDIDILRRSPPSERAKSRNWPMVLSISSTSAVMPSRRPSSPAISMPMRRRVSGVRRSWEMPARIRARSWSSCARSALIWLKAWATVASSVGTALVEPPGRLAGADLARRLLQRLERARDAEHDEPGAEQREQERGHAPAQPAQGKYASMRSRGRASQ
jgi:hypothetical protein